MNTTYIVNENYEKHITNSERHNSYYVNVCVPLRFAIARVHCRPFYRCTVTWRNTLSVWHSETVSCGHNPSALAQCGIHCALLINEYHKMSQLL